MKTRFLSGVLTVAMVAFAGMSFTRVSAAPVSQLWSVAVHLAYADGSSYDIVLRTGLEAREMSSMLAECGRSHWTGSVVRYHCYPIPE